MNLRVRAPDFVWRTQEFVKLLGREIYAFIARKSKTLKRSESSDSLTSRGPAGKPAKVSSTAKASKNTGAPKESSKSNVNAGGQTTSNSGTSRGPPAAPQPVNAGGKTTSNSGTNSRGQPHPRHPRPVDQ